MLTAYKTDIRHFFFLRFPFSSVLFLMTKDEISKAQNLSYVIRSGIAGGVAGCMVNLDMKEVYRVITLSFYRRKQR